MLRVKKTNKTPYLLVISLDCSQFSNPVGPALAAESICLLPQDIPNNSGRGSGLPKLNGHYLFVISAAIHRSNAVRILSCPDLATSYSLRLSKPPGGAGTEPVKEA